MTLRHRLRRDSPLVFSLSLASWMAAGGCSDSRSPPADSARGPGAETRSHETDGGGPARGLEFLPFDGSLLELIGERDLDNLYSSTVMVEADESKLEFSCSGVLLHPRLVLTAGHCVCSQRKGDPQEDPKETLIDDSACAGRAQVTAILHTSVEGSSRPTMRIHKYEGQVRPHPKVGIRLDARGNLATSHADLAVIFLEKPVSPRIPSAPLAETEAQTDELLIMAGYGNEEAMGGIYGTRYFKKGKVKKTPVPSDERILYEPQGAHFNTGYRGGPCFRENPKGRWLVGIVGLGNDKETSCTSTSLYRPWLHAQLQQAERSATPGEP